MNHSPGSLVRGSVGELLGHKREREEPPGEVEVGRKAKDDLAHAGELPRAERQLVEPCRQPGAALLGPKVGCQSLYGAVVDVELAVRIPARRQQEQRAPARLVQLGGGELERLSGEVGQDDLRVPELSPLELRENVGDGVHVRIMT